MTEKSGHRVDCDNGCGCRGNAIPPTSVILARLDPDALGRWIAEHWWDDKAPRDTPRWESLTELERANVMKSFGARDHAAAVRAWLLRSDR